MADDKYEVLLDFVANASDAEAKTDAVTSSIEKQTVALEQQEKVSKEVAKGGQDTFTQMKRNNSYIAEAMKEQARLQGEKLRKEREYREEVLRSRRATIQAQFEQSQIDIAERNKVAKEKKAAELAALAEKERIEAEETAKIQAEIAKEFSAAAEAKRIEVQATEDLLILERARAAVKETGPVAPPLLVPGITPEVNQEALSLAASAEEIGVQFKQSFQELVKGGLTGEEAVKRLTAELKDLYFQTEEGQEQLRKQQLITAGATSRVLRAQAAIIRDNVEDTRREIGYIKQVGEGLASISKIGLGVGVGLVGGAFAFATKYVRDAKESTAVTLQWKAAQESLARSSARVGEVVAQQALPLLLRAATIAEKTAQFIERNPELVRSAINVGLVTAAVSTVGLLVSKGIKLYADVAYLATVPVQLQAARLQSEAAAQQLIAAKLRAQGAGLDDALGGAKTGGASSLLRLGPLAAILGGAAAFTTIGTKASQAGAQAFGYDNPMQFWEQLLEKVKSTNPVIRELVDSVKLLEDSSASAASAIPTGVRASPEFENILKAYESYLNEQKELERKYASDRVNIIREGNQAILQSDAQFAANRARIIARRDSAIDKAEADFARNEQQAEQDNAQERADIVREGGEEVIRIEEALQETLRKNSLEHESREQELLAARDAVGLLLERKRFNQQQAEAKRDANLEIAQHRADIAQRLVDNAQAFEQERARRLEEHQLRVAELQEQAANELKELRAQHVAEVAEIRKNTASRVRELDNQFNEERRRRYQQFIQQIRDLDANLLGERKVRQQHYAVMTLELDKFLAKYRAGFSGLLSSLGSAGSRAGGGYAGYGTYLLGDRAGGGRGKPEYVLDGNMTELAERVLGGNITQSRLAELFNSMGGGRKNSVTYNDNRRTDSRISSADRERLREDTMSVLAEVLS